MIFMSAVSILMFIRKLIQDYYNRHTINSGNKIYNMTGVLGFLGMLGYVVDSFFLIFFLF